MDPEKTIPPETKTSILPAVRSDLPDDAPWWAKYAVAKIGNTWKLLSVNIPIIGAMAVEIDQATGGKLMELALSYVKGPHAAAIGLVFVAALHLINQQKGNKP